MAYLNTIRFQLFREISSGYVGIANKRIMSYKRHWQLEHFKWSSKAMAFCYFIPQNSVQHKVDKHNLNETDINYME